MFDWYWAAKLCGMLPLVLGSGLFFAWSTTHRDWMLYAGLLLIPIFLLIIISGFVAIGLHIRQSRQTLTPYVRRSLFAIALLLSNFPVGASLAYLSYYIQTAYIIRLQNQTLQPIEAIIFTDPTGKEFAIKSLPPQGKAEHQLHFSGEGQVKYRLEVNGTVKTGTLLGYVTNGMGGQARLIIENSDRIIIREQ